eukprot:624604-Hanusia_phi.AAC.1
MCSPPVRNFVGPSGDVGIQDAASYAEKKVRRENGRRMRETRAGTGTGTGTARNMRIEERRTVVSIMVAFLYSCSASYCRSTILLPSESLPPPQSPVRFSPSTAVPLRLRGGSIVEDLLSQEDSGASSSSYDESLYNLTAGCLIDPEEQGNLTRVYDLFIRPPLLPPMKDGRQLSGIGLILTRTPPYTIQSIHPQVRQTHEGLLNVGDELVAINGESLKGKSWEQVRSLAIGEEATQ